jgi:hypothetical protein
MQTCTTCGAGKQASLAANNMPVFRLCCAVRRAVPHALPCFLLYSSHPLSLVYQLNSLMLALLQYHHCRHHVMAKRAAYLLCWQLPLCAYHYPQVGPGFHLHSVCADCLWPVVARIQQLGGHRHQHRRSSTGCSTGREGGAGTAAPLPAAQVGLQGVGRWAQTVCDTHSTVCPGLLGTFGVVRRPQFCCAASTLCMEATSPSKW